VTPVRRFLTIALLVALPLSVGPAPSLAQVRTIDPNQAIDSDLQRPQSTTPPAPTTSPQTTPGYEPVPASDPQSYPPYNPAEPGVQANGDRTPPPPGPNTAREEATANAGKAETFKREEILSAAEGTFGKGAAGLAGILERTLKEQGEPNAYISGREAAGAIAIGLRYGKGTMFHKVEGQMPVYWTGPSIGFDLGANAGSTFVLVYNLYDTDQLYERYPAGEGDAYVVGGLTASYMRKGNVVLIPIRVGAGLRLGVNAGYMKFSKKQRWLPF
jgi:hypothetical protein